MKQRAAHKLKSGRGMTMVELLCAVAVMALMAASIGLSLPLTVRSYQDVQTGSEASILCSTLTEAVAQELRFSSNAVQSGTGFVYDSQTYGAQVQLLQNARGRVVVHTASRDYLLVSERSYSAAFTPQMTLTPTWSEAGALMRVDIHFTAAEGTMQASAQTVVRPLNLPQDE